MEYQEIEEFLVEKIAERLKTAQEADPEGFHQTFAAAYDPLRDLSVPIDYSRYLTGEAYALKYHLQRMDNLNVALNLLDGVHPLFTSAENVVLDIGAGTGAGAMAILRWLSLNPNLARQKIRLVLSEPSDSMRKVAKQLVPAFANHVAIPNVSPKFFREDVHGIAEFLPTKNRQLLDLTIFSYTFWIQDENEWAATTNDVLRITSAIKSGGVLLFLTPDVKDKSKPLYAKVLFMNHLREELKRNGWRHLSISSPKGFDPDKSTTCVKRRQGTDAKRQVLAAKLIAGSLKSPPLQGDDLPYYSFSATIDAFTR